MPIVLLRVDERLIHGQVVVGWGERLHMDRIVVIDDSVSESAWEQELYCLGVPPEIEASFVSVDEARKRMSAWREDAHRTVLLVRDLSALERLASEGVLDDQAVNLGGIHHAEQRERVLPYLFLSEDEQDLLRGLADSGINLSAQDLPSSRPVPADELLRH